jgi:hypothetical protein
MGNITEERDRLWDEFEKRTANLYGAELAEEMNRFVVVMDELDRRQPPDKPA